MGRAGAAPPDGGWGWVVVGSCFMVMVCTRAVTRCVSIFFLDLQTHFGADSASTSWVHSLLDCSTMLWAPAGSLLARRWSPRGAVMLGGGLASLGLLLASLAPSLQLLHAAMGGLTGLGFALCYSPALAQVGVYFGRRRAWAFGVALAGGGLGSLLLAPGLQWLLDACGWRGALLTLAAAEAHLCVCGALLRPIRAQRGGGASSRTPGEVSSHDVELGLKLNSSDGPGEGRGLQPLGPASQSGEGRGLQPLGPASQSGEGRGLQPGGRGLRAEYGFLLRPGFPPLAGSVLLLAAGCSPPFVFLAPFARSAGASPPHAAMLLSALGVVSILGNLSFGWLTDRRCLRRRRRGCFLLAVAAEGLSCLAAPALGSAPLLLAFAVLYGYFDGAYVALIPVVTADVVGAADLPAALGVVYFLHAVPYLLSPPLGGWLVDLTGGYTATFLLSGAALLASAVLLAASSGASRLRPPGPTNHSPPPGPTNHSPPPGPTNHSPPPGPTNHSPPPGPTNHSPPAGTG